MIILSFSVLVFMQVKLDNTQNGNKACNRCNSPKNRNNKTENLYFDPFSHLIARL